MKTIQVVCSCVSAHCSSRCKVRNQGNRAKRVSSCSSNWCCCCKCSCGTNDSAALLSVFHVCRIKKCWLLDKCKCSSFAPSKNASRIIESSLTLILICFLLGKTWAFFSRYIQYACVVYKQCVHLLILPDVLSCLGLGAEAPHWTASGLDWKVPEAWLHSVWSTLCLHIRPE